MRPLVQWAVKNSPAVNTMMVGFLLVGAVSMGTLRREFFPQFELEIILVTVPYPGASPEEAEEGICQKVEEAVRSIEGIKKMASIAQEGAGFVILELETWVDVQKTLNSVRSEVDRIPSFPELSEDPEVEQITFREPVIRVGVIGPPGQGLQSERELRDVAERIRQELQLLPNVTQVEIADSRPYQIDVELTEDRLREYGLTLSRVAQILRQQNIEMPGGLLRTSSEEILLRGKDKRLTGDAIAEIPLVTQPNGTVLRIRDLGNVRDGFEDVTAINRVDGQPALTISVDRSSSEDLLRMVDEVKEYVAHASLPSGYRLKTWGDTSVEVRGRMNLLLKNGLQGLVLVFLVLAVFLEFKLAFWVAMGIPMAVLGAGIFLLYGGQTLNMLSMFAFLMALGIVVDDAIVVGENIFAHRQRGDRHDRAAVAGTMEVLPSVTASVSTTIIAFMPLLFVSGVMGKFIAVMPIAVIAMLVISLIESTILLPCHLAHVRLRLVDHSVSWGRLVWAGMSRRPAIIRWSIGVWIAAAAELAWRMLYPFLMAPRFFHWFSQHLDWNLRSFIERVYAPVLAWCLRNPAIVVASSVALLMGSLGLVAAGITPFIAFPKTDSNEISASITFPDGSPAADTYTAAASIEQTILRLDKEYRGRGLPLIETTRLAVGQVRDPSQLGPDGRATGSHVARVDVELVEAADRELSSQQIIQLWRDASEQIPAAESVIFQEAAIGPGGTPIEFRLLADKPYMEQLEAAVEECKTKLATFAGIVDIRDDSRQGKWEFQIRLKDKAEALGISLAQLSQTIRGAYYGEEAMRLQRGRHEVKLMARYPPEERKSIEQFHEIRVRGPDGTEYPITELADIRVKRGISEINRIDQLRSIAVLADVIESVGNARETVNDLKKKNGFLDQLQQRYPRISVRWEGQQQQTTDSISSLIRGLMIAVVAMFVLLTIEFRSYFQPLLILMILPFGLVGALWGHAIMGMSITLFSVFGLVALTGVIVNDSIVLVDAINHRRRDDGMELLPALEAACQRRFRPVLLTSVTTIAGLTPMLFETSFQAQFLIPLAVTMVFGLALTTQLVLILVPTIYSVYDRWLVGGHIDMSDEELVPQRSTPRVTSPAAMIATSTVTPSVTRAAGGN